MPSRKPSMKFHLHDLHFITPIDLFSTGSATLGQGGMLAWVNTLHATTRRGEERKHAPLDDAWFLA